MIDSLSIVFPIFNEEKRLNIMIKDINDFNEKNKTVNLQYVFVNDGSNDNTQKILKSFISNNKKKEIEYLLIDLDLNQGKGKALKEGIKLVNKNWILTLDADMSVSLQQIHNWINNNHLESNFEIYFGSRNIKNAIVDLKQHRKILGKIFSFLLKILFNIQIKDTQCGFKLYKSKIAKKIFKEIHDNGFVHDVEVVLIATKYGYEIKELPVKWIHKNNSKLNLFKDPLKMFLKLINLKLRY